MSTERTIEAIVIACLQTGALAGEDIRHHDEDGSTMTEDAGPSRLVVKCEPPVPNVPGTKPSAPAAIMQADVSITAHGVFNNKTADQFDAWAEAVDANLETPTAAAITLAEADFSLFELDVPNQGQRWQGTTDTRTRTRSARVIFRQ